MNQPHRLTTTTFTGVVPQTTNPFSHLPDLMQQLLEHEENAQINMSLEQENHLTSEQGDAMMGVIRKVILQTIKPSELLTTIKSDLGLDEATAKKLTIGLLGWRFLPMDWYLGGVAAALRELGEDPSDYVAELTPLYPEIYPPAAPAAGDKAAQSQPSDDVERYLPQLEHHLSSFDGQAEVLLRLTGLGDQIEAAMKAGKIETALGEKKLADLDAVSSMINSQDLNPFEVQAIRRRLTRLIGDLEGKL